MASKANPVQTHEPNLGDQTKTVSYLDPGVASRIKTQAAMVWDRVSASKNLTQSGLANALQMTTSGVNKLLRNMDGHPWTPLRLKQMATFIGANPLTLIDPVDEKNLRGFFEGWGKPDASAKESSAMIEECFSALTNFYTRQGVNPAPTRLRVLAGKLAANLEDLGRQPSKPELETAMSRLVLQEAMAAAAQR